MEQMRTRRQAVRRFVSSCLLLLAPVAGAAAAGAGETEPQVLFKTRCAGCHAFGKGERVGPDLKGAVERHPREWLVAWIRSSDALIRAGDPAAVALFDGYRQQRMPDHDLSDEQIGGLLDYLAAGGPERDAAPRIRLASSASPEEVQLGRDLFFGKVLLTAGRAACGACHSLSVQRPLGASLAPDLSHAYAKYRDQGLATALGRPCIPQMPLGAGALALNTKES